MSTRIAERESISNGRVTVQIDVTHRDEVFRARWRCDFCGKRWDSTAIFGDAEGAKTAAQLTARAHVATHGPPA